MQEFPALGGAVRSGELPLGCLQALEEVRDARVRLELVRIDEALCRIARRASMVNWRREVRRRAEIIRAELAARDAEATADDPVGGSGGGTEPADQVSSGPGADGTTGDAGSADSATGDQGATGERGPLGDPSTDPAGPDHPGADRDLPDGVSDEGWLSWRSTSAGGLVLRGELHGTAAEVVRQVLAGEVARQRRAAWSEHDTLGVAMPTTGQLRARALVELLGDATVGSGPADGRREAVVVIEADDRTAEGIRSLDGEPIGAALAAALSCDAHLQPLIVDRRGQPLWLGRSTRLASAAQRRVLAVRDGGCVFPGCDMPPECCDAHHQPGWGQGGRSDPEHLVLLCRRHHGVAHSRHWQLRPVAANGPPPGAPEASAQRFEWVDRHTGTITTAQQRGLRSPPTPVVEPEEPTVRAATVSSTGPARAGPRRRCA
jgi:hypothetical protein